MALPDTVVKRNVIIDFIKAFIFIKFRPCSNVTSATMSRQTKDAATFASMATHQPCHLVAAFPQKGIRR